MARARPSRKSADQGGVGRVPNERFWKNKCPQCVKNQKPEEECPHTPFGRTFYWQWHLMKAMKGDFGPIPRFYITEIHRRGRKSSLWLNMQIRECYRIPKTRHPIICPSFAEAKRIYFQDPRLMWDSLPGVQGVDWEVNQSELLIYFPKLRSIIPFYGGDDPGNLSGIEGESFVFDEFSLQKVECWTEIVRPIVAQDPSKWVAFSYTPKPGGIHATRMFDYACMMDEGGTLPDRGPAEKMRSGWYATRLSAFEFGPNNEILPLSGIMGQKELQEAWDSPEMTRELFCQEFGCHRITEESFVLITSAMLQNLVRKWTRAKMDAAIIACDPSMGGDACAISVQWGGEEIEHKSFRTRDTMRIVGELRLLSDQYGIMDFIIDSIGIGAGVAHALAEDTRYHVQAFNSAEHSAKPDSRVNKRADAWWFAREDVMNNKVSRPSEETCRQIPFASKYTVGRNGKIQILSKEEIKKLLGRSPDDADVWAYGRYGIRKARQCMGKMASHVVQVYGQEAGRKPYDPMDFINGPSEDPQVTRTNQAYNPMVYV